MKPDSSLVIMFILLLLVSLMTLVNTHSIAINTQHVTSCCENRAITSKVNTDVDIREVSGFPGTDGFRELVDSNVRIKGLGNRIHQFHKTKKIGIIHRCRIYTKDGSPLASDFKDKDGKRTYFQINADGYKYVYGEVIDGVASDDSYYYPDIVVSKFAIEDSEGDFEDYTSSGYFVLYAPHHSNKDLHFAREIVVDFYMLPENNNE